MDLFQTNISDIEKVSASETIGFLSNIFDAQFDCNSNIKEINSQENLEKIIDLKNKVVQLEEKLKNKDEQICELVKENK